MAGTMRDRGAGAKVELYDTNRGGVSYVMKQINQPGGDWDFKNLHLFMPGLVFGQRQ